MEDKIFSSSSRFRPYETISFDPPIKGINGAELLSYTWAYEWKEEFNPIIGEDVTKRVSDWSQAEMSADTGKNIVHQFTIKSPDGEVKTVSSESVLILLGYTEREKLKSFPSLVNAIKTLAKQKMKLAIMEAQQKEFDEVHDKFKTMEKPPIIEADYKQEINLAGDLDRGRTIYKMGDTTVWQYDKSTYDTALGKSVYTKLPHIDPERKDCLIDAWIREQVEKTGVKKAYGLYDLKQRIVRQERKVKELSKETSAETKQFAKGGSLKNKESKKEVYFIAKENVQSFPDARKFYFTEGQKYLVSGNYLPEYAYIIDNFNKEHLITQEWMHKFDIDEGDNKKTFKKGGVTLSKEESDKLSELLTQKQNLESEAKELWEKEKTLPYGEEKNKSSNRRNVIRFELMKLEPKILNAKNKAKAIENGGSLELVIDKQNGQHPNIPNFTNANTENFIFDVETILTDPIPPYIPFINEDEFRLKGFVFDVIRIGRDKYLIASNGYNHRAVTTKLTELGAEFDPSGIHCFVLVTLDQLVLTNDYYFTKAKAILQKEADDSNRRAEEYYDKLPLQKRQDFFAKNAHYRALPTNVKKKVTEDTWNGLSLEEKLYKPIKHYGAKRISSRLEETQMWLSFAEMYRLFVNPEATQPKKGYEGEEVFGYWRAFREMMKWKIQDIYIQRERQSELRKVAMETSFGDSNTNPILKQNFGILVKRQDGSQIKPAEIEQIEQGWLAVEKVFGSLKERANADNLKISHTGLKFVFASKAVGMYVPSMNTIAVSAKYGVEQFNGTLAHEIGHFLNAQIGISKNRREATDDFESTAGILASTFRRLMNEQTDSKYLNVSTECLSRAMQMFFAISTYGDSSLIMYTNHVLETPRPYFAEGSFVSKENYYSEIKPLCELFLKENNLGA